MIICRYAFFQTAFSLAFLIVLTGVAAGQSVSGGGTEVGGPPGALADRILARPLFIPGRRADVESHPVEDAAPSSLRLVGVVFYSGTRRALVQLDSGKPVLVAAGGSLSGYTIRKIGAGQIEAEGFGETRTIKISKQNSAVTDNVQGAQPPANAAP